MRLGARAARRVEAMPESFIDKVLTAITAYQDDRSLAVYERRKVRENGVVVLEVDMCGVSFTLRRSASGLMSLEDCGPNNYSDANLYGPSSSVHPYGWTRAELRQRARRSAKDMMAEAGNYRGSFMASLNGKRIMFISEPHKPASHRRTARYAIKVTQPGWRQVGRFVAGMSNAGIVEIQPKAQDYASSRSQLVQILRKRAKLGR